MGTITFIGDVRSNAERRVVTEQLVQNGLFLPGVIVDGVHRQDTGEEFGRPFRGPDQLDSRIEVRRELRAIETHGVRPMPARHEIGARLCVVKNVAIGPQDQRIDI